MKYCKKIKYFISLWLIFIITAFSASNANANASEVVMVLFGDGVIGSYNIPEQYSFARRIEDKYRADNYNLRVINSGIKDLLASDALNSVKQHVLDYNPDIVMLSLGQNDYANNSRIEEIRYNIEMTIWKIKKYNPDIKLSFLNVSTYDGQKDRHKEYIKMLKALATKYQMPFYKKLRKGVANKGSHMQDDFYHLNGRGVLFVIDQITPYYDSYIKEVHAKKYSPQ